jgi:hypothetical protein
VGIVGVALANSDNPMIIRCAENVLALSRLEYEHSMLAARSFAHSWFGILAAITLVGCASNPPEEVNRPTVQTYAQDYQGLFQRISTTAKRCFASKAGLYRSGAVDADLYSEIGYGQLTLTVNGTGTSNYYVSVRIEKQSTGSKLTMISDNMEASQRYRELVSRWANGDQNCPAV